MMLARFGLTMVVVFCSAAPLAAQGAKAKAATPATQIPECSMYEPAPFSKPGGYAETRLVAQRGGIAQNFQMGLFFLCEGLPWTSVKAPNFAGANSYLSVAADLGSGPAQAIIGAMAFRGEGRLKDDEAAYMWLNLAAASGQPGAGVLRDKLAQSMGREEILKAQALSRDWKPNLYHLTCVIQTGGACREI